jgi:hypothetical protein
MQHSKVNIITKKLGLSDALTMRNAQTVLGKGVEASKNSPMGTEMGIPLMDSLGYCWKP